MQRITNDLFDKIRAVTHPQQLTEAKMDPVGKEDADVNNDGKKDKSDKYLLNRRKAISTAIKNEEANFNPAPEPEERIENPTLNDKIREKAMQAAARISGMSGGPKVLSDIGPGAEVKEDAQIAEGEHDWIYGNLRKVNSVAQREKLLAAGRLERAAGHKEGAPATKDSIKDPKIVHYYDVRGKTGDHVHVAEEVEQIEEMEGMLHDPRTIKSINKMKEVGTSKHKMAPAFHASIVDAMKNKDHAKIDRMHKAFKMVTEEESHQSKTTMKHIPNASSALKKAAKDIKPGIAGYRDRIDMLKAGGVKEEVELGESVTETIVRHNDFTIEITDNPTFADFFKAVQSLAGDTVAESEIIAIASEAFDANAEEILIENFTRMEIMDKHAAHRKAGNLVSHEKFSNKEGKPYAEYVVTDKEGGRKKYIHHGSTRRMESMASKK